MNDLRLEIVGPETPDKATLELLAQMLNRESSPKADGSFYFEVNPEHNEISIHFRRGEEYCVLNAVTTIVGTTIEMQMPSGTVAIFTRDKHGHGVCREHPSFWSRSLMDATARPSRSVTRM